MLQHHQSSTRVRELQAAIVLAARAMGGKRDSWWSIAPTPHPLATALRCSQNDPHHVAAVRVRLAEGRDSRLPSLQTGRRRAPCGVLSLLEVQYIRGLLVLLPVSSALSILYSRIEKSTCIMI